MQSGCCEQDVDPSSVRVHVVEAIGWAVSDDVPIPELRKDSNRRVAMLPRQP